MNNTTVSYRLHPSVTAERERIRRIEKFAGEFAVETIHEAKYGKHTLDATDPITLKAQLAALEVECIKNDARKAAKKFLAGRRG